MNRDEFLTDEDIHGLEEDSEIIKLQNKINKLEEENTDLRERNQFLENKNNTAKNVITDFIKLNSYVLETPGHYSPAMVDFYKVELGSYQKAEKILSDE